MQVVAFLWFLHAMNVNHLAIWFYQRLRSFLFFFSLSRIREAEQRELNTLDSIVENVKWEERDKMVIADFGSEIERFILQRRKEQHKKLLQVVYFVRILTHRRSFYVAYFYTRFHPSLFDV